MQDSEPHHLIPIFSRTFANTMHHPYFHI